jgi:outer membrane protein, multidrug efflux system
MSPNVTALRQTVVLLAAAALGSCAVGPNFKRPDPAVPATWSATAQRADARRASATDAQPVSLKWWQSFQDGELASLLERSVAANLDVREAVLRIEESRAQRAITAAAFWPSLGVNAGATRQRLSLNTPNGAIFGVTSAVPGLPQGLIVNPYNQFQLGLSASWEPDLFGRVRRSVEAADADTEGVVESEHDVLLALLGDVAQAYIDLRGAQTSLAIVQASLTTQRDLLDLTRQRREAGLTSDLDVQNAAAEVESSEAQLPTLERQITQDINQLSRLMTREPDGLRAELEAAHPVPPVPPLVPIGLPADLARRRPDIRRSEASLHAATARVGVAVAALFPSLTLNASGGWQTSGFAQLLETASHFSNLGATLELPIFDGGERRATIRLQDVRAQEAGIDYARTVLGALHEVENALAAYASDQQRRVSLAAAAESSRAALLLARQRYESGLASFIDVLDAERTEQQNELSAAQATTAVSSDLVSLYRALGGGWESPPATTSAQERP